jgi:hypothetical protein
MANCRSARAFFVLIRSSLSISFFAWTCSIIFSFFLLCSFSSSNLCSLRSLSSAFSFSLRFCDSWRWERSDPVAVRRFLFLIFCATRSHFIDQRSFGRIGCRLLIFSTIPLALYFNHWRIDGKAVYL